MVYSMKFLPQAKIFCANHFFSNEEVFQSTFLIKIYEFTDYCQTFSVERNNQNSYLSYKHRLAPTFAVEFRRENNMCVSFELLTEKPELYYNITQICWLNSLFMSITLN